MNSGGSPELLTEEVLAELIAQEDNLPLFEKLGDRPNWLQLNKLTVSQARPTRTGELTLRLGTKHPKDYWFPVDPYAYTKFLDLAKTRNRGAALRYLQQYIRQRKGYRGNWPDSQYFNAFHMRPGDPKTNPLRTVRGNAVAGGWPAKATDRVQRYLQNLKALQAKNREAFLARQRGEATAPTLPQQPGSTPGGPMLVRKGGMPRSSILHKPDPQQAVQPGMQPGARPGQVTPPAADSSRTANTSALKQLMQRAAEDEETPKKPNTKVPNKALKKESTMADAPMVQPVLLGNLIGLTGLSVDQCFEAVAMFQSGKTIDAVASALNILPSHAEQLQMYMQYYGSDIPKNDSKTEGGHGEDRRPFREGASKPDKECSSGTCEGPMKYQADLKHFTHGKQPGWRCVTCGDIDPDTDSDEWKNSDKKKSEATTVAEKFQDKTHPVWRSKTYADYVKSKKPKSTSRSCPKCGNESGGSSRNAWEPTSGTCGKCGHKAESVPFSPRYAAYNANRCKACGTKMQSKDYKHDDGTRQSGKFSGQYCPKCKKMNAGPPKNEAFPSCKYCGKSGAGVQFQIFNPRFKPFGTACTDCEKSLPTDTPNRGEEKPKAKKRFPANFPRVKSEAINPKCPSGSGCKSMMQYEPDLGRHHPARSAIRGTGKYLPKGARAPASPGWKCQDCGTEIHDRRPASRLKDRRRLAADHEGEEWKGESTKKPCSKCGKDTDWPDDAGRHLCPSCQADFQGKALGAMAKAGMKMKFVVGKKSESTDDLDDEDAGRSCSACGGQLGKLGDLGTRRHYRCRNCGAQFSRSTAPQQPQAAQPQRSATSPREAAAANSQATDTRSEAKRTQPDNWCLGCKRKKLLTSAPGYCSHCRREGKDKQKDGKP